MGSRRGGVKVGLVWDPQPPLSDHVGLFRLARLNGLDFVLLGDHVQGMFPRSIWDARLGGFPVRKGSSPHECFEVFTLLGRLSGAAGRLQLGVGVADVLRRHPIVLAQAALTLARLLPQPFILGLGAGERVGTEPYGLDPVQRASRLEEAARYVRTAFDSGTSFDLDGSFYSAKGAIMDLRPPAGRTPRRCGDHHRAHEPGGP
jgi:phthiodiolone/phenolphthiodiolone dimycocerosates ketoreductase